jgi:hypothetical protein
LQLYYIPSDWNGDVNNIIDDPRYFSSVRAPGQRAGDPGYFPAAKALPAGVTRFNVSSLQLAVVRGAPLRLNMDV